MAQMEDCPLLKEEIKKMRNQREHIMINA